MLWSKVGLCKKLTQMLLHSRRKESLAPERLLEHMFELGYPHFEY